MISHLCQNFEMQRAIIFRIKKFYGVHLISNVGESSLTFHVCAGFPNVLVPCQGGSSNHIGFCNPYWEEAEKVSTFMRNQVLMIKCYTFCLLSFQLPSIFAAL